MKKFLKIFLISLASLLLLVITGVVIVLWFVFTPEKLTPVVRNQAAKYINCQMEIDKVELTFFSTFPQFGLKTGKLLLINPVDGALNDTLVRADELTGIINIKSLINNNELLVNKFRLTGGSIYAFTDSLGNSNFDIFPADASAPDPAPADTASGMMFTVIDIEHVELQDVDVTCTDKSSGLYAAVRGLSANINGRLKNDDIDGQIDAKPFDITLEYSPDELSKIEAGMKNLSLKADVAIKSGTVSGNFDIKPFDLTLRYDSDSLKFDMDTRRLSAGLNGSLDDDHIAGNLNAGLFLVSLTYNGEKYLQEASVQLNTRADIIPSRQYIKLESTSLALNDFRIDMAGTVENDTTRKHIATDLSYRLDSWNLRELIKLVPASFASYLNGINAGGNLSSEGKVKGIYSASDMPLMDIHVALENGTFGYAGLPLSFTGIHADADIYTDMKSPQSYVRINRFRARTPASSVSTSGVVDRLFSDIHANLNTDIGLDLSEVAPMVPDSLNVKMRGRVAGNIKSDFSMSQIENMQLEKMKLAGSLSLSHLNVAYDSLSVKTGMLKIDFALPNPKTAAGRADFVFADISTSDLTASKIYGPQASLKNASITLETSNIRDTTRIPDILCSFRMEQSSANISSMNVTVEEPSGNISVAPRRADPEQPEIRVVYHSGQLQADYNQYAATMEKIDLHMDVENDKSQKDIILQWNPRGKINLEGGNISTSALSHPVNIPAVKMDFTPEEFHVEKANIEIDQSDFNLAGKLNNVSSYFRGDSILRGNFNFVSAMTDVIRVLNLTSGIGYEEENTAAASATDDTDSFSGPYMVPKGMDILLHTDIKLATYGIDTASNIKGNVRVHDGDLVLEDLTFTTPAADMELTAMYRTQRKNHLYVRCHLHMLDIEIAELLRMVPEIDTIMPMLQSFGGKGEFYFAFETYLDSLYNLKKSTLRGASSIRGTDLVLMDGETFTEIARTLRFSKKAENRVDSLSAEFTIFRQEMDIYPFLIVMDRYKAVVGGRHNLDMSFNYNISLVESPLPVRLSVKVRGTPENMKYKLTKNPYPKFYRPAARKEVENEQLNLRKMIRDALTRKQTGEERE
jgi:hypothetical protein